MLKLRCQAWLPHAGATCRILVDLSQQRIIWSSCSAMVGLGSAVCAVPSLLHMNVYRSQQRRIECVVDWFPTVQVQFAL